MARYTILAPMLAVPRPMPIAQAETPAEAVRIAREFEKNGKADLKIGESDTAFYMPVSQFAAEHGIR